MGVLARTCMKSFQAVAECFLKAVFLDGLSPPGVPRILLMGQIDIGKVR